MNQRHFKTKEKKKIEFSLLVGRRKCILWLTFLNFARISKEMGKFAVPGKYPL